MNEQQWIRRGHLRAARPRWVTAVAAFGLVTVLAACSSSGNSGGAGASGSTTPATSATTPSSSSAGSSVAAQLAELYTGTSTAPASTSPKPQKGKTVWIISVIQSVDVAHDMTEGAADAARAIGWKPTIYDGKGQPNLWLTGIQQAIAAKADGIITYGIDCATVKTGLEAAKAAHIPVVAAESQDCTPSLESVISYSPKIGSFNDYEKDAGVFSALYLVGQGSSSGTFIELKETDTAATLLSSQGYESTLKADCPKCKNVVVTFTAADIGPALQQKTQQALLQNPTAVGLVAPYDGVITSGVSAAVVASGRAKKLLVVGSGGSAANLDLIRQDRGQTADLVVSTRWEGFSSVDWLNRLFNGATPDASSAGTGIGYQLVDKGHNLPASGPVSSSIDFASLYEKAWGVSP